MNDIRWKAFNMRVRNKNSTVYSDVKGNFLNKSLAKPNMTDYFEKNYNKFLKNPILDSCYADKIL